MSFTFKVKKKVHNKQGTKKSPILKVRYKFRAEPRKKIFDADMAELVVYLIELKEPFTRQSYLQ